MDILSVLQKLASSPDEQIAFAADRKGYLDSEFPGLSAEALQALLSGSRSEVLAVVDEILATTMGGAGPIHIMYPGFHAVFRATSPVLVPVHMEVVFRVFLTIGEDEAGMVPELFDRLRRAKGDDPEGVFLQKDGKRVRCQPIRYQVCDGRELTLFCAGEAESLGAWWVEFDDGGGILTSPAPVQAVEWPPKS